MYHSIRVKDLYFIVAGVKSAEKAVKFHVEIAQILSSFVAAIHYGCAQLVRQNGMRNFKRQMILHGKIKAGEWCFIHSVYTSRAADDEDLSEFCNILKYLSPASVAELSCLLLDNGRWMKRQTDLIIFLAHISSTLVNATCECKGNVYTIIFSTLNGALKKGKQKRGERCIICSILAPQLTITREEKWSNWQFKWRQTDDKVDDCFVFLLFFYALTCRHLSVAILSHALMLILASMSHTTLEFTEWI